MDRKKLLLLGAVGVMIVLALAAVAATLLYLKLRPQPPSNNPPPTDLTYCNQGQTELCVVSFGADNANRMLINFVLPDPSFPAFYVKVQHNDGVGQYDCKGIQDFPTNVYCAGDRTPLGDPITIEVYSNDKNVLLAQGNFVVSAIALPTAVMDIIPTPTALTAMQEFTAAVSTPGTVAVFTNTFVPPVSPSQTPIFTPSATSATQQPTRTPTLTPTRVPATPTPSRTPTPNSYPN